MDTISESLLSTELQELYLQNKEWMSQVLFLEDESRFFQKLFVERLFFIGQHHSVKQVELISECLLSLEKRTVSLKTLVLQHQHLLENILTDPAHLIGMRTIEEHAVITQKIKELLYLDRVLKSELFAMVESKKTG